MARLLGVFPFGIPLSFILARTYSTCNHFLRSEWTVPLQKGGIPAAPSGTATLLRLSPSYRFYPRTLLAAAYFRYPQLPWLDGRCVQGPGTYSPHHC
jgi:hypothetical protein